ncbi:right-handed parallel beta-helix repeat-containing protein [Halorubrum halophilum]|uniref:right-handed parallel beta-helix repeat-containing protein n=1 Tax=Halorubrum halophilum TaxID=413816 RepID=UPI00186ADD03|nr:right-handed parallel beta-helix repeat-containing protein [Halorubrum halophilum]
MKPLNVHRRTYLGSVAAAVCLAGCGNQEEGENTSVTDTESTDSNVTENSTETTSPVDTIVFDGGGTKSFREALRTAETNPGATLHIRDGPHELAASEVPAGDGIRTHFVLDGASDVTIEGNDNSLVFTDPSRGALAIRNSEAVTVQNLTVDYNPVPFTQATIDAVDTTQDELVVTLQDGFPSLSAPVFEKATLIQATVYGNTGEPLQRVDGSGGAFKRFSAIEQIGERRFRLTLANGIGLGGLSEDRILVVAARYSTSRVLRYRQCVEPTVKNCTIHTAPGYAVYFNYCAGPVVQNSTIAPPTSSSRLISGCSDGIHFDNCREKPTVERCRIAQIEDDGIVIDTQMIEVASVEGSQTVRVAPSVGSLVGAGDQLEAASSDFVRKGELPTVNTVDMQGGGRTDTAALPELIIFEDPIDDQLTSGDYLTATAFENRGFSIQDNVVTETNARLIRIGGGVDGVVAGNELVRNNNDGILVEANGGGTPKRWVDNLTIRENTLHDIGLTSVASGRPEGIVVQVDATPVYARDGAASVGRPHRNVHVEQNEITGVATTGIHFADLIGGSITGNKITDPGRIRMIDIDPYGVGIDNSSDLTIEENSVIGTGDDVLGFGWRTGTGKVHIADNNLDIDGRSKLVELVAL